SVYPDCKDDACNKQRDEELKKSKVKAKIFPRLFYRHWNAFTEFKRSHLFVVSADANPNGGRSSATPGVGSQELAPPNEQPRDLTEKFDRSVGSFTWSPNSAGIFFAVEDRGDARIAAVAIPYDDKVVIIPPLNSVSGYTFDHAGHADDLVFAKRDGVHFLFYT